MKARHIEAVLQLRLHNDEAQALYDQFLEETGEDDECPDRGIVALARDSRGAAAGYPGMQREGLCCR